MSNERLCCCPHKQETDPECALVMRLARAAAQSAELYAGADEQAKALAQANARAAELMAELELKNEEIMLLNAALAARGAQLEQALAQVRTLSGVIPICMHCHQIRDDGKAWQKLERYISEHSDANFSHSLCPTCLERHYPDRGTEA
ncbi:MAG: hypothetical protein HYS27_20310 [Deltaproteobacteria bacterium]|nr:hypothetical protein [Deltaproteobacteria bacterium]